MVEQLVRRDLLGYTSHLGGATQLGTPASSDGPAACRVLVPPTRTNPKPLPLTLTLPLPLTLTRSTAGFIAIYQPFFSEVLLPDEEGKYYAVTDYRHAEATSSPNPTP